MAGMGSDEEEFAAFGWLCGEARTWWQRYAADLEAGERDRREWIEGIKRRLGLITADDRPRP